MDAYVVKCNYSRFAFIGMSNRRPTGETSLSLKLYSESTLPGPRTVLTFDLLPRTDLPTLQVETGR